MPEPRLITATGAALLAIITGACAGGGSTATAAPRPGRRPAPAPKPRPPHAAKRTPYQAYVAFARMYAADLAGRGNPFEIPAADQIAIAKLGAPLPGVTLYYADGGQFDDTPHDVYQSMLLADVDGRILVASTPMQWAASSRWRAVACTETYLPDQRALEKTGYTEQGLKDLEAADCVDLTPRVAALFTADTTAADLDGLLALMMMFSEGQPGLSILHDAKAVSGLPIEWVKPAPTITAPTLTRDPSGAIVAHGFVLTESHVLRLTLRVHAGELDLDRDGAGSLHISIP